MPQNVGDTDKSPGRKTFMKSAKVLVAMVFTAASVPFMAQQAAPPDQQSAPPPPAAQSSGMPAAASAAPVTMSPVNGELTEILDSKTAKAGDSVVIKTKSEAKTADGTSIPKGSKLIGHVTGVKASGQGNENSQVSLEFDRAELKGGQSMAIRSELQSLSPAGDASTSGTPDAMAGSAPGTQASSSPSGGMSNPNSPSGAASNSGSAASSPTAPAGAQSQNSPAPGAAGAMPSAGTVVARTGSIEIKTTSIPGVLLASNEPGQQDPRMAQSSGILLGAKRDIHLDGGTKVVIGVASAGASPGGN
jgi:hypothetical protein